MTTPPTGRRPTLAFIHTAPFLAATFRPLAEERFPGWDQFHMADESLLKNTIRDGAVSPMTLRRLTDTVFSACDAGADAIVVTCSSLGAAADLIAQIAAVPVFRIDRGMAIEAVAKGTAIGVLATLDTTLQPTNALVRNEAAKAGRAVSVTARLCEGAFSTLMAGDREGHDRAVRAACTALAADCDVIVLAQASMAAALAADWEKPDIRVLTSPEIGLADIAARLAARPHPE